MTDFGADGFQVVLTDSFDSMAAAMGYLEGLGFDQFVNYDQDPPIWPQYGYGGSHPHTALIDMDGNVRKSEIGAIDGAPRHDDWLEVIAHLTGNTFP